MNQHCEPLTPNTDQGCKDARKQHAADVKTANKMSLANLAKTRDWKLGKFGMDNFSLPASSVSAGKSKAKSRSSTAKGLQDRMGMDNFSLPASSVSAGKLKAKSRSSTAKGLQGGKQIDEKDVQNKLGCKNGEVRGSMTTMTIRCCPGRTDNVPTRFLTKRSCRYSRDGKRAIGQNVGVAYAGDETLMMGQKAKVDMCNELRQIYFNVKAECDEDLRAKNSKKAQIRALAHSGRL